MSVNFGQLGDLRAYARVLADARMTDPDEKAKYIAGLAAAQLWEFAPLVNVLVLLGKMGPSGWLVAGSPVYIEPHLRDVLFEGLKKISAAHQPPPKPQWAQLAKKRIGMEGEGPSELVSAFQTVILYGKMLKDDGFLKPEYHGFDNFIAKVFQTWKQDSATTSSSQSKTR